MKHVVITGSTRGIGYGLAVEFLRAGCKVTINGRAQESVDHALWRLKEVSSGDVQGFAATTENREEMDMLWTHAEKQFGKIDIWINNAGIEKGIFLIKRYLGDGSSGSNLLIELPREPSPWLL